MIAFANEWGWWAVPAVVAVSLGAYLWRVRRAPAAGGEASQYLTIEQVRQSLQRGEPLQFADVRSESSYEASVTTISGAVRLHPQRALGDIRALGIAGTARIVTFCA
jgi:hypothetical protein